MRMHSFTTLTAALLLVMAIPAGPAWSAGPPRALRLESKDLAAQAGKVPVGGRLELVGVRKAGSAEPAAFQLQRYEVFASDARITVHGPNGDQVLPAPATRFFRGTLAGEPSSRVFLAVPPEGEVQGVVTGRGNAWLIGKARGLSKSAAPDLVMSPAVGTTSKDGFACSTDLLPQPGAGFLAAKPVANPAAGKIAPPAPPAQLQSAVAPVASYTARIAVETDFELYEWFNDVTAATNYIAGLIGYASIVYSDEISTSLVMQSLSLWTTSSDPWMQFGPLCSLYEFGRYWNDNHGGDSRTVAHFLSGKPNGAGIAWIGVLCLGAFDVDTAACPGMMPQIGNYGGAYGYTGDVDGDFDPENPNVIWDIYAFTHEIGHNFNSPHTHCYKNIGGNANPVDACTSDECSTECNCGSSSLPGPAAAGSGTIMSYCHLLTGGYSNITLTFGTGHSFGIAPERVPSRMSSHVASAAAFNPSCLALVTNSLFSDGFESGTLNSWATEEP